MSLYKDASLVMIPSAVKDGKLYSIRPTDGAGDFTFSRGSNLAATRVDVNGLIEKGRENLILYSQDFSNAAWVKSNVAITANQSDPIGGTSAFLVENQSTSGNYIYQNNAPDGCFSVYAKAGNRDSFSIISGTYGNGAYFDLSAETATSYGTGSLSVISSVGNNWYRCSVFVSTGVDFLITLSNINGGGDPVGDNMYFFGAQAELGLVATDYIETGASTAQAGILEDLPRLDYSGGASCPSLLLEPQRSNLITQSEYFGASYWTKANTLLLINELISPDGDLNSEKFYEDTALSTKLMFKSGISTLGTISVFAKKGDENNRLFQIRRDGGSNSWSWFDLENGVIEHEENGISNIENYGNGWFRCSFTPTNSNGTIVFGISNGGLNRSVSYQGDGTSGVYIYGAQLEAGSYPTSYIPTYGSAVTRSYDSCQRTGIADLLNDSEGVFMVEFKTDYRDAAPRRFSISDGTTNNRVNIYASGNNINGFIGGTPTTFTTSLALGEYTKVAFKYKSGDNAFYVNGTQIGTSTDTFTLTGLSRLGFDLVSGANLFFGDVKQTLVFPTALTDSECIALTTL